MQPNQWDKDPLAVADALEAFNIQLFCLDSEREDVNAAIVTIRNLHGQVRALQAAHNKLISGLKTLETDAHYIFNNSPGQCQQGILDVIEWYASSVRVALETTPAI